MEDLFDTDEKKANATAALGSLVEHPGWKIMVSVWQANIQFLREQLENGLDGETKEDIDRLRDKLAIFKENISKPQSLVESFQVQEVDIPESDPFPTAQSLIEERNKNT